MDVVFNALILIGCGALIIGSLLYCYVAFFWAERFRQLLLQQPEYRPSWFYLIDSTKPLKWWHLYRRFLFTCLIGFGWVSNPTKAARSKSQLVRTLSLIMPKQLKAIYTISLYAAILMMLMALAAMTIGKIYNLS